MINHFQSLVMCNYLPPTSMIHQANVNYVCSYLWISRTNVVILSQSDKVVDTTAAQARRGQDIQGIPWDNLSITRERYRRTRLEQYKNYENIPGSGDKSGKVTLDIFKEDSLISIDFPPVKVAFQKHNSITPFNMSIIACRTVRTQKKDTHFMTLKRIQDQ